MRTVFKNGRIFTGSQAESAYGRHSCMIVNQDLIEYVGNDADAEVEAAANEGATVLDLGQQTLAPGFIDSHMHLLMFGFSLPKISIEHCKSLSDIQATIRQAAKEHPSRPRLLCQGWMHFMTDGHALASDLEGLDEQNRPIFIDAKDLHSTWCNNAALEEMAVQDMPDPPGGEIKRDEKGNPTGLMSEAAGIMVVWPHLARVASMEDKLTAVREAIRTYNAAGYTGMIEMAMDENGWEALLQLRSKEELSIRLAVYWLIAPSKTDEENFRQVGRAVELWKQYNLTSSPDLRIAGIKIIGDGVIDACTAALLEPYSSTGISIDPLWDADMLKKVVQRADAAGLQCALHAIGDATIKISIDALETVASSRRRHRIEHLELTSPGDAKRLSDAGITASIQAVHADPAILRQWKNLLGAQRRGRAFAYREFLDEGVRLALGTDAPTAPNLPLPNLYTATTRRSAREPDSEEVVNKHFALPLLNAFSAATRGAAHSVFLDKITGSLEAGMKADFVVLDMEWSPEKLLQAKVKQTWFNGKQVYGTA
ncbi:amidohydrolase family protein [Cladophialophora carrionii]|uniref:Amidohydrolase family protein n=1 Tax=Cladophialophora carrionii TaxID=86049 RepID=A0A1C1CET4_9EURO|nr:amidohydrolase family protein [Cladophialophora carrionii]